MNEFIFGKIVKSTSGLLWVTLLSIVLFTACKEQPHGIQLKDLGQTQSPVATSALTPSPSPTAEPSYTRQATLVAVGDVMMHSPQITAGYDKATQTYNYDSFFSEVKAILSTGDWAVANLETPLAGKEAGYSGYPQFNAPAELADAMKNAGFNIITTANNHSLDRREHGVINTLEHLHARGLTTVGTAISQTDANKITIVTKNEISMAILAYTYGTNGIPIPEGKDYLVSLIDEEKMIQDIARAREQGVDLVTIVLHFGLEYQRQPNEQQKQLVEHLIKAGADIILGSHPHVVQPYQFIDTVGIDGLMKRGLAIYSMGNFISNQT
ncbi:MAG TPA: CapA family protein, partial [Bacilli bacterium]